MAERVDRTRQAGADGAALGSLERELAEVRNALRSLTPAENLAGFEEAVRALSHKIDQIAASGQAPQGDPMAFKQLEQAVVSLRGAVSNVASDGALAQLAAEVRGLGAQFERATADSSTEALAKLEARIASLMESGRAVPPELEGSIRALSERLDRMQLSQGDQLALGALEDRIAKLSEKLDASDSRLGHLEAIERGLADLLVYLEEMRSGSRAACVRRRPSPLLRRPRRHARRPKRPQQRLCQRRPSRNRRAVAAPAPAADAAAPGIRAAACTVPAPLRRTSDPTASAGAANAAWARSASRSNPNLPPDTPLEPGSGAPRMKPGSAAARIAASEAALGNARPMAKETGGKSAAIAAARNAAKAAYLDTPVKVPKSLGRKPRTWLKWPFKKAAKDLSAEPQFHAPAPAPSLPPMPAAMPAPTPSTMPDPMSSSDDAVERPSRGKGPQGLEDVADRSQRRHHRCWRGADRDGIFVCGYAARAGAMPPKDQSQSPAVAAPRPGPQRPRRAGRCRRRKARCHPRPANDPEQTNSINGGSSFFDPSTAIKLPDVTGSIPRKPRAPRTPRRPVNRMLESCPPRSVRRCAPPLPPTTRLPNTNWAPAMPKDAACRRALPTPFAGSSGPPTRASLPPNSASPA